jgi:hypothetical protein
MHPSYPLEKIPLDYNEEPHLNAASMSCEKENFIQLVLCMVWAGIA